MTECQALKHYEELCTAYGRTSQRFNTFAELLANMEGNGIITEVYDTPEETSYEFADGSTVDIIKGLNHMSDKAVITNGIVACKNFDTIDIVCNYK